MILALLSINRWKIKDVINYSKNGLCEVDMFVSSNYEVYINGYPVLFSDVVEKKPIEGFEEVSDKLALPTINHYKITNLTVKPEIKIVDNGNIIEFTKMCKKNNIRYIILDLDMENLDPEFGVVDTEFFESKLECVATFEEDYNAKIYKIY